MSIGVAYILKKNVSLVTHLCPSGLPCLAAPCSPSTQNVLRSRKSFTAPHPRKSKHKNPSSVKPSLILPLKVTLFSLDRPQHLNFLSFKRSASVTDSPLLDLHVLSYICGQTSQSLGEGAGEIDLCLLMVLGSRPCISHSFKYQFFLLFIPSFVQHKCIEQLTMCQ